MQECLPIPFLVQVLSSLECKYQELHWYYKNVKLFCKKDIILNNANFILLSGDIIDVATKNNKEFHF